MEADLILTLGLPSPPPARASLLALFNNGDPHVKDPLCVKRCDVCHPNAPQTEEGSAHHISRRVVRKGRYRILQLMRMHADDGINQTRPDTVVSFPLEDATHLGSLVAVILHHGSSTAGGHYTCYAKRLGSWLRCDDANVSAVPAGAVQSDASAKDAVLWIYEQQVSGVNEIDWRLTYCRLHRPPRRLRQGHGRPWDRSPQPAPPRRTTGRRLQEPRAEVGNNTLLLGS
jgi:hypothetical protein